MVFRAVLAAAGFCFATITAQAATVDFNNLPTGALLSGEGLLFGSLTINVSASTAGDRPIAVFDTDKPTGDNPSGNDDGDLQLNSGSTCRSVDGGTVAALTGGCPGSLGKALVIHEETPGNYSATSGASTLVADGSLSVLNTGVHDPAKVPDDYAGGGRFTLDFGGDAVTVASLGVIDIENGNSYVDVYTNDSTTSPVRRDFAKLGDASFQDVIVGVENVTSLEFNLGGSGAIPYIELAGLTPDPTDTNAVPASGGLGLLLAGLVVAAARPRR